jgi:aspartate ammonia-lyase
MTLGQEFEAFARSLEDEIDMLTRVESALHEVNMGGTAIGTGLNAPASFSGKCVTHLAAITGMPIRLAADLVEATQDTQAFVLYSSCSRVYPSRRRKFAMTCACSLPDRERVP